MPDLAIFIIRNIIILLITKPRLKDFYESGIGLDNLIKINVQNTVYLGFGAEDLLQVGSIYIIQKQLIIQQLK